MRVEPHIIELKPYAGSSSVVWGLIAGNTAIVAAAALVHTSSSAAGLPDGLRIAATIVAGALVTAALVVAHRHRLGTTATRLVLTGTSMQVFPRRGSARTHTLSRFEVRRLAYLSHEWHPGRPHVMVLELRAPRFRPLRIYAPPSAGSWPEHEGEARLPPTFEVSAEDWTSLCEALQTAGALPPTGEHRR